MPRFIAAREAEGMSDIVPAEHNPLSETKRARMFRE